jgi:hypothetical protein
MRLAAKNSLAMWTRTLPRYAHRPLGSIIPRGSLDAPQLGLSQIVREVGGLAPV